MTHLARFGPSAVRQLSPEGQGGIARLLLHLAKGDEEREPIDLDHLPAVLEGLSQVRRREFASDEEAEPAFRRFEA